MDKEHVILESKEFPKVLTKLISMGNEKLESLQEQLNNEVVEAAIELMTTMNLSFDAGWRLDLDTKKFVRLGPPPTPTQSIDEDTSIS